MYNIDKTEVRRYVSSTAVGATAKSLRDIAEAGTKEYVIIHKDLRRLKSYLKSDLDLAIGQIVVVVGRCGRPDRHMQLVGFVHDGRGDVHAVVREEGSPIVEMVHYSYIDPLDKVIPSFNLSDIMACRPCEDYPQSWVEGLLAGRQTVTAKDLAKTPIASGTQIWILVALLSERRQRLAAVDFATRISHLLMDERSHEAIRVARRFAFGLATDVERQAAQTAALGTVGYVHYTAAYTVAHNAHTAAQTAAGQAVACITASADAERAWQLSRLVEWHDQGDELEAEHRRIADTNMTPTTT